MDETKPLMVSSGDNGKNSYHEGNGTRNGSAKDTAGMPQAKTETMKWIGAAVLALAVFGLGTWYGLSLIHI